MKIRSCLLILFLLPLATLGQSGMWTWMKGSSGSGNWGTYGVQGVEDPANNPPAFYEACNWTDLNGNFWLFGGGTSGLSTYGDLWRYNPNTNNWTWMKGSGNAEDGGHYGTMGVPDINNYPHSTGWGASTWVDKKGDLWLYGGNARGGTINDLWRYNIASNTWTWINGSAGFNVPPTYGTQGVPSASNTPGGRQESCANWVDANNNLWLFGGNLNNSNCNDLWKFDIAAGEWTWMGGSSTPGQPATYGTKGIAASSNIPGARDAHCAWKDLNNKIWLFGGGESGNGPWVNYNDMWMYDPATNLWAWMSGDTTINGAGNYGPLCSSSENFLPMAREETRSHWVDNCGKLWLYGGAVPNIPAVIGDLWCFDPVSLKWALVNGTADLFTSPVYGTIGVAAATNQPGCRSGALAWYSKSGDLYMFGGFSPVQNAKNDVWKYRIDLICPVGASGPVLNIGNDTSYCNTFSRTLYSPYTNTAWSTGDTAAQITVADSGLYWAVANTGCSLAKDSIHLSRLYIPTPFSLGNDTTYCNSVRAVLATGLSNTMWSTGVTGAQITATGPGTYMATVSNTCGTARDTVKLSLINPPPAIHLGADTTFCSSINLVLATDSANTLWSTGVTAQQIAVTSPGAYWARTGNQCGIASDTISIQLTQPLMFSLGPDTAFCAEKPFNLTVPVNAASFLWSTGETSSSIIPLQTGPYWAKAWNVPSCPFTDTVNITINTAPRFSLGPDTSFCSYTAYPLRVPPAYLSASYHWQDSSASNVLNVTRPGQYTLTITNECGTYSSSRYINILYDQCYLIFPNVFSPNGDGINDFFRPNFQCTYSGYHLSVYNRWGQKVFESNNADQGWDGKYSETELPIGVYVYYAAYYSDCEQKLKSVTGNVSLIR